MSRPSVTGKEMKSETYKSVERETGINIPVIVSTRLTGFEY